MKKLQYSMRMNTLTYISVGFISIPVSFPLIEHILRTLKFFTRPRNRQLKTKGTESNQDRFPKLKSESFITYPVESNSFFL